VVKSSISTSLSWSTPGLLIQANSGGGKWEPLPAGRALIDYWRGRLGKAERLIIETLTQAYPAALNKEEIAARAGSEANDGGFNNALGRLRTLELVQG